MTRSAELADATVKLLERETTVSAAHSHTGVRQCWSGPFPPPCPPESLGGCGSATGADGGAGSLALPGRCVSLGGAGAGSGCGAVGGAVEPSSFGGFGGFGGSTGCAGWV